MKKTIVIIGGGAAGMMAAVTAARNGKSVILLEQNEKLGKKIYITGKGRCNFTNAGEMEDLFAHVVSNPKFLYSAFYTFDNFAVMDFFHDLGLNYKIERGNRVFPVSDHASDVIKVLQRELERLQVKLCLNTKVEKLMIENQICKGVILSDGRKILADSVIVATGGLSYTRTGSTGDGFRFAEHAGLGVIKPMPSLVPFNIKEAFCKSLMGLSLKNVTLTIKNDAGKKIYSDFGEMLFTHFGISGPLVLSASAYVHAQLAKKGTLQAFIDLKPALTKEQLDARLLREFEENKNKQFKNSMDALLPKKLIPVIITLCDIDPDKKMNTISKEERARLVQVLKEMPLTINGMRGFEEAIVTKGGVAVKGLNPSTMEAKEISGLYFAGEVIDLDALTGGYNLQIAWSTGYIAGLNC